jgi:hypothetical protein
LANNSIKKEVILAIHVTYGIGGWCENCDSSHDHPLHNIISQEEAPDPEPVADPKQSAIDKLRLLGLTDEEIQALIGA